MKVCNEKGQNIGFRRWLYISLSIVIFLVVMNIFFSSITVTEEWRYVIGKFSQVAWIAAIGWFFVQLVNILGNIIFYRYVECEQVGYLARKMHTRILIVKRIVLTVGLVVILASMLMVFDSVRSIGTGLLTTAGIVSAVVAIASKESLSRLFSGLQIAFTQPIRIGDTIIVENESGEVEEITLSYVVIKLWDLRRLILPIDYFTKNSIQNLTRESTELLGAVFFCTDYTLPVDVIRQKLTDLLKSSSYWDAKVGVLQVTDIKEGAMELRALVSAANASHLWQLRCEIREKLMQFIVDRYPDCLVKSRNLSLQ
ncbi:MAG TPA: mechanosensitive ion channel domain-containing protein [Gammaproteobacteria bacterium]|jgi:small-conductance mechanosensitive channel|nr:mechanosensitive ion channel domain-containing protein [Gammaproteobacteria bacterium]